MSKKRETRGRSRLSVWDTRLFKQLLSAALFPPSCLSGSGEWMSIGRLWDSGAEYQLAGWSITRRFDVNSTFICREWICIIIQSSSYVWALIWLKRNHWCGTFTVVSTTSIKSSLLLNVNVILWINCFHAQCAMCLRPLLSLVSPPHENKPIIFKF